MEAQVDVGKEDLKWLEFDLFKPYPALVHGVFSRRGGVSKAPFDSLNVSDSVGDLPDAVKFNRQKIVQVLGAKEFVFPHQTHGVNVLRVTAGNAKTVHQADALMTNEPGIALAVAHADCQAAIFYDPVHKAIAVAHAGWRGLVQNVYAKVIAAMEQAFGSRPQDLAVAISPSLGPDHAEFKNYKKEFPQEFWTFQTRPDYFDLRAIGKSQLAACNIPENRIEIANACTYCEQGDYFSFRRAEKTGRNATVAMLKP